MFYLFLVKLYLKFSFLNKILFKSYFQLNSSFGLISGSCLALIVDYVDFVEETSGVDLDAGVVVHIVVVEVVEAVVAASVGVEFVETGACSVVESVADVVVAQTVLVGWFVNVGPWVAVADYVGGELVKEFVVSRVLLVVDFVAFAEHEDG